MVKKINIILAVVLLAWAFWGISPALVWEQVQGVAWGWLLLGLSALLASVVVRAQRWATLLGPGQKAGPFRLRRSAVFIGFGGNCLLPAHAGDFLRAVVLSRFGGVPFGPAFGSIVGERFLDLITVILTLGVLLLLGLPSGSDSSRLREFPIVGIVGLFMLVSSLFYLAIAHPQAFIGTAGRMCNLVGLKRIAPRIEAGIASLLDGLAGLNSPRAALVACVETALIWILVTAYYGFALLAFGIISPGVVGSFFVQSVISLGVAIPSSPGYFGPYEAATRLALEIYRVPIDTIAAYALVTHLTAYASLVAIAVFMASRLGLSWNRARSDFVRPACSSSSREEAPR